MEIKTSEGVKPEDPSFTLLLFKVHTLGNPFRELWDS
jgi:hypothetical protein